MLKAAKTAAAFFGWAFALAPLSRAAAPAPMVALEPPPGWTDVTGRSPVSGVLLSLRGPGSGAFAVARMPASALQSAAQTQAYLSRVLDGMKTASLLDYRTDGRVETKTFRNGVTARFLRASLDGRPRLIVAALDTGGPPVLGTLSSAAPDAMMASLFGALAIRAGSAFGASTALSSDGQLQVPLGGGLRSRPPTADERRDGVALVIQGAGSEVLFLKVSEEDAAPKDQAAIARATVADAVRVRLDDVSPPRRAATPAGPGAVYAWAKVPGSPALRFAAGFLPWSFWGYSLLARGPQADELLVGALAALRLGPTAVPAMVAASPRLEVPERGLRKRAAAGALASSAIVTALIWSRRRKKG